MYTLPFRNNHKSCTRLKINKSHTCIVNNFYNTCVSVCIIYNVYTCVFNKNIISTLNKNNVLRVLS